MLEKLKEYFEMEYQDAKELITNRPGWIRTKQDEKTLIDRTISRCLGARLCFHKLVVVLLMKI